MSDKDLAKELIGDSLPMRRLRFEILRVARTRLAVLIQGPTGAGKELVARALHRSSERPGSFVAFNASAIADSLVEDTLFGHVRGAFTDARADMPGLLLEAHRGTAFFDEITGVPWHAQAKLLRAVELGEFRPLGARADRRSDFRVVAASNDDVRQLVEHGRFRADLYERVSGFVLRVPPLSERLDDIPQLASFLLRQVAEPGLPQELDGDAIRLLQDYHWPGNVRELRHVLARAAVFATGGRLGRCEIVDALSQYRGSGSQPSLLAERKNLLLVLDATNWRIDEVARQLGVSRATVYRWMQRLGVKTLRRKAGMRSSLPCASDNSLVPAAVASENQ